MLPAGRKSELEAIVSSSGHVTVTQLTERFGVSADTIRRDLDALSAAGKVVRTRGGAMSKATTAWPELTVNVRQGVQNEAKEAIADLAVGLISDSSSIILNAGSTGLAVARRLQDLRDLTVATNNILVPSAIDPTCLRELYLLGGRVRIGSQATVGALSLGLSPNGAPISIAADIALISVGALSADRGFSTGDPGEAQMMASMMERADLVAMMVDSSKFEKRLFAEVAPLAAADFVITDAPPPENLARALADAGVKVLVPSAAAQRP